LFFLIASRRTHTQKTTKLTKKNRTGKQKWKRAKCEAKKKIRKTSEADFFRNMKIKIKISYTLEDGHVGGSM
jgi:hypothetical protein